MHKFIYGFHSVIQYIESNPRAVAIIYYQESRQDNRLKHILDIAQQFNIQITSKSSEELNQLINKQNHQGIVAQVTQVTSAIQMTLAELLASVKNKATAQILILDGITDPHNLGAIIRTAEFFAVDAVIVPKNNSADINNPIIDKTSSGANNHIPLIQANNLSQIIQTLKQHDFWIAGTTLSPESVNLFTFKVPNKLVWVLGNEGHGMRRLITENCDYLITIPSFGQTPSLNVSVTSGIVLSYTKYMSL